MSPAARMIQSLAERSISGDADSVKHTFSSWDNCMAKAYCKWPVIAVIIVGSLILLSIAGCLISCLCCGYQCCKGCCGCCYRCCDCGGNSRNHKKKRDSFGDHISPYYQQPPPPQPMNYGNQPMNYGNQQPAVSPAPPAYRGPRTAAFDQPKAATAVATNEDALPAMPTWADAQTRRVEDHSPVHETVEMDDLEAHDHANNPYYNHHSTSPAPGLMTRGGYSEVPVNSTSPHSPQPYHDDYLHDEGYSGAAGGLRVTNASNQDLNDSDYLHQQHQPYSPIHPTSPGYGPPPAGYPPARYPSPGAAAAAMPSRLSPRPSPGPEPYRGFDNQPPKQVPNFSGPRAYDQVSSPRSPVSPPMPYAPYEAARSPPPRVAGSPVQHGQYRAFSPAISSSTPPPPFSETDHQQAATETSDGTRPPTLLMAGRRPTPNSYRAV